MINLGIWTTLILILILRGFETVTVVDHYPNEEYILEHEVLYEDAIVEAKELKLYAGPIPGCKSCTSLEMTYCKNGSVLKDHCCCDSNYNKVFLFVRHTCRVGPEACKVQAGDCAEYTRLRECCCHSYLTSLWKYLASGTASSRTDLCRTLMILILFSLFL